MPLPSKVHQNQALENISIAYKNGDLIADELCPMVPVQHESDSYYVFSRDSLNLPETARADGAEANQADFSLSTATYRVQEHSLKRLVTDRSRKNADPALDLDVMAVEHLTNLIKVRQEVELACWSAPAWRGRTPRLSRRPSLGRRTPRCRTRSSSRTPRRRPSLARRASCRTSA